MLTKKLICLLAIISLMGCVTYSPSDKELISIVKQPMIGKEPVVEQSSLKQKGNLSIQFNKSNLIKCCSIKNEIKKHLLMHHLKTKNDYSNVAKWYWDIETNTYRKRKLK